jgi:hypothetical protein
MAQAGYTCALIAAIPLPDSDPAWLTRPASTGQLEPGRV